MQSFIVKRRYLALQSHNNNNPAWYYCCDKTLALYWCYCGRANRNFINKTLIVSISCAATLKADTLFSLFFFCFFCIYVREQQRKLAATGEMDSEVWSKNKVKYYFELRALLSLSCGQAHRPCSLQFCQGLGRNQKKWFHQRSHNGVVCVKHKKQINVKRHE